MLELHNQLLSAEQSAFLAAEPEAGALALIGPPASGKSHALCAQIAHKISTFTPSQRALVLSPADCEPLARRLRAQLLPTDVEHIFLGNIFSFARMILNEYYEAFQLAQPPRYLSDTEGFRRCRDVAQPLYDLAWPEFSGGVLDPEVSGIRSPGRFLATTYRLFERLRSANIDPLRIDELAARGSTLFYAAPPNFANPELLRATKDIYRDSLRVTAPELEQQRRREADLAVIVARLARLEAEAAATTQELTPYQLVQAVVAGLKATSGVSTDLRARFPRLWVDDAQDLDAAQRALIAAVYGPEWSGVAFACDPDGSVRGFEGARAKDTLAVAKTTFTLSQRFLGNAALWNARAVILSPIAGPTPPVAHVPGEDAVIYTLRAEDRVGEAAEIAAHLRRLVGKGAQPRDCAVIVRSLPCAWQFVKALLAAALPVDLAGPVDPLWDPRCGDLHAILGALAARDNAAAFLRLAQSPLLALSDHTIALLAHAPGDPSLFAMEPNPRERRGREPDRLAQTMLDGVNDTALETQSQARLQAFRRRYAAWQAQWTAEPTITTLENIFAQSGLLQGSDVNAQLTRAMAARYLGTLEQIWETAPVPESLAQLLEVYRLINETEAPPQIWPSLRNNTVTVMTVEAARGFHFEHVVIPDAKAGAFPRYYVPDAFLFSPTRGFIPRENVAASGPARTAKFSWYLHAVGVRESYNLEERRVFASALGRATKTVFISASGPATRGATAPEFLEEVRRARLPGTLDIGIRP